MCVHCVSNSFRSRLICVHVRALNIHGTVNIVIFFMWLVIFVSVVIRPRKCQPSERDGVTYVRLVLFENNEMKIYEVGDTTYSRTTIMNFNSIQFSLLPTNITI